MVFRRNYRAAVKFFLGMSLSFVVALVIVLAQAANAEVVWRSKMYLATQIDGKYQASESSEFGCEDTIYLFYESADQSLVDEKLEVVWQHRESKLQHQTSEPFQPKLKGGRLWSWSGIEFQSGASGLDKLTAFLDPAAGREQFIGEWQVTVFLREKSLKTLEMRVLC